MVKQYVKTNNTTYNTSDVKHLLHQAIDRVEPKDWQFLVSHVKDEEQKFWDVDFICDELIDELQVNPNHIGDWTNLSDDSFDDDD